MEIKQETKSLPRNRKCGNCRYFEPAPLWRKGWCRNPRLYDRRANHLVDAATIDCEQVFRARIYWEPVPSSEMAEFTGYGAPTGITGNPSADSGQADSGGMSRGKQPTDGILRPRAVISQNTPPSGIPVITRREKADATPGLVRKPSQTRRWLVENIPYYDKIDGPISRINLLRVLPWVIILAVGLFLILNLLGPKKGNPTPTDTSPTQSAITTNSPGSTQSGVTLITTADATTAPTVSSGKPVGTATPTISNLVPTSTAAPPTPTVKAGPTQAKVNGTDGVNLRKDPGTNSQILTRIASGQLVTITSADRKTIDGGEWWPVSYKGQDGWVLSTFLDRMPTS